MEAGDGLATGPDGLARCWWGGSDPLYIEYHDHEWGRPELGDRRLFGKLCLEGFQSGLSWLIILRKRENFRAAFAGFDFERVARFHDGDVERLLGDAGIVRNRPKILATINNARRCSELVDEFGSLAAYFWSYEPDPAQRPDPLDWSTMVGLGVSPEATAMSKDLKKRGWAFVGPTTVHSAMESCGLINNHVTGCFARDEVTKERSELRRPERS